MLCIRWNCFVLSCFSPMEPSQEIPMYYNLVVWAEPWNQINWNMSRNMIKQFDCWIMFNLLLQTRFKLIWKHRTGKFCPSPDIALSDTQLYRSMTYGLAEQQFHSNVKTKKWIDDWVTSNLIFNMDSVIYRKDRWK